jgi:hypothetical protein
MSTSFPKNIHKWHFLPTLPKINVQEYFIGGFEQLTSGLAIFLNPAILI